MLRNASPDSCCLQGLQDLALQSLGLRHLLNPVQGGGSAPPLCCPRLWGRPGQRCTSEKGGLPAPVPALQASEAEGEKTRALASQRPL